MSGVVIALVDDTPDDRALAERALRQEFPAAEFLHVRSQEELDATIERSRLDLVVTDYHLQWGDGLQVYQAIKLRQRDCVVILFTGTGNERLAVEAMRGGIDDYVIKSPKHYVRLAAAARAALRRAAERRQHSEVLRQFADAVGVVIFLGSPQGDKIEYVSPAFETIWGRPRQALLDRAEVWIEALHPEDRAAVLEAVQQGALYEQPELVFRILRPDGEVRWIRSRSFPIYDEDGAIARGASIAEDITAQKDSEVEAERRAEKLKTAQQLEALGRLAGGVAHDFNNLLTVLRSSAEFLADATEKGDPRHRDINNIQHAALRAAELTEQLLAFSSRKPIETRVMDLSRCVSRVLPLVRRLIGTDVQLEFEGAAAAAWVRIDTSQFDQIVLNLASNARDAMPRGGRLTFQLDASDVGAAEAEPLHIHPGPHARLRVSDTGEGMSPDTLQRVFEPFFTTKAPGKGTGLGLSTVFGIVRQFGGDLRVESVLGQGSTFTIYLPTAAAESEAPATESPAASDGGGRILLVEDDEMVRRIAVRALERAGYVTVAVAGPYAALERLASSETFDLLLTDVVMPELGGGELVRRARKLRPKLRVLFMSGYASPELMASGQLEGDENMLGKPFTPAELVEAVREAIDEAV